MSELTVNKIVEGGLLESLSAADAGGDSFKNEAFNVFLKVDNADASGKTVTITPNQSSTTAPGFGVVDKDPVVVVVAAGTSQLIGPFAEVFNDINGDVNVSYDAVTSVTVGAFKVEALR